MMDIPEDKNRLIALKLGKIRDELAVQTRGKAEKTRNDWAKKGFTIYTPDSEFHETWIPYLKLLARKYMDTYLEVLAPNETPISDDLLNSILMQVIDSLQGPITGVNQELSEISGNRLSYSDELDSTASEIRSIIERELKIKQGDRNSVTPEKEEPKGLLPLQETRKFF